MRRFITACVAGALLVTAACGGGESGGSDGRRKSGQESRKLFQPAGVVGPDSFAPSFAVASYDVSTVSTTNDEESDGDGSERDETAGRNQLSGTVSGSTPGLYAGRTYGGSGSNICDVEGMITFLTTYEERGRAWAAIQGIPFEQLGEYIRGLTPVFALQNLNVTMFGFKNGKSYGYSAVMEAGTALLIDDQGMPRARCACGNPLLGPTEEIPDGTDQPTPDEGEDGNPQTQDSVTPESGSTPSDQPAEQPGDQPREEPGVQPTEPATGQTTTLPSEEPGDRPQREPECPDWNNPPPQYVDPNGGIWVYVSNLDVWVPVDSETVEGVATEDLPGYLDLCGDPDREFTPACPYWNPVTGKWAPPAEFVDSNGDRWLWQSDTDDWAKVDSTETSSLLDIPGYVEICLDPIDSEPACPTRSVDGWTPYQNAWGDTWVWVADTGAWYNEAAEVTIPTLEEIPGYLEECGRGDIEYPCPPLYPLWGESWIDPAGDIWVATDIYVKGRPALGWENSTTGESATLSQLFARYCGDPVITENPPPLCPPSEPVLNETWIDVEGNTWIYAPNKGGVDGWDNLTTESVEVFRTDELPDTPEDCAGPPPATAYDCPPVAGIVEGSVFYGSNGSTYVFTADAGGWVGDAGDVIAFTVLLPGYRQACLPPCPPVDAHLYESVGVWVDPSTGHIWVKPPDFRGWVNLYTRDIVEETRFLPFWEEECRPPCAPGATGEPTFVKDEEGRPILNPTLEGRYDDVIDNAVTVEPGADPVPTQDIVQELLAAVTATGDDCNPIGCVDIEQEPVLGHLFVDSYGIAWRYVGDGVWQSELGDEVDDVLDIPGYAKYCLPTEVPLERECPEEYEGNRYTDTRNITWIWVGGNPKSQPSDRGKKWFTRYDDGSTEYRYTFQLETFFEGCPRPDGLELPDDVVVSARVPRQVCVGDIVEMKVVVQVLVEGTDFEYTVDVDGETLDAEAVADSVWIHQWIPGDVGDYEIVLSISTSNGSTGDYAFPIEVIECVDAAGDYDNGEPYLEANWYPDCVEVTEDGPETAVLEVVMGGFDSTPLTITINGGDPYGSPEIVFPEERLQVDSTDTVEAFYYDMAYEYLFRSFEFSIDVSDGNTTLTTTAFVSVQGVDGCQFADPEPEPESEGDPGTDGETGEDSESDSGTDETTDSDSGTDAGDEPAPDDETEPEPEPNYPPDVYYDLASDWSGGACEVRVSAVDTDRGQTVYIGANAGEARSSTSGEVTRVYLVSVKPTGRGSLPAGHRAFDSEGASVPLSFSVVLELVNSITNEYRCVED